MWEVISGRTLDSEEERNANKWCGQGGQLVLSPVGDHLNNHVNAPQNCSLRTRTVGILLTDSCPSFVEVYTWKYLITGFSKLPLNVAM